MPGILPVAASAQPYILSADGSEATDQETGLIWRRCPEGMNWDGSTCAGVAVLFTYEAALRQTAAQAGSTGVAWRLPNINELSSIIDRSRINSAIDPTAFPSTPASWFWSASPLAGSSGLAWYVNFVNGAVSFYFRPHSIHVRLVRTRQ